MTTVQVKTADLRGFAGQLKANAGYVDNVLKHVQDFAGDALSGATDAGLFGKALGFHGKAVSSVTEMLTHLSKVMRGSATELEAAAKFYDHADEAARERIEEASYSFLARTSPDHSSYGYKDVHDLSGGLPTPYAEEYGDPYHIQAFLDSVGDMASISGLIFRLIELLTGKKPLEDVANTFAGDWEAWGACSIGWRQVGDYLAQIAENINRGAITMSHAWEGIAGGEAFHYFDQMQSTLASLKKNFGDLADAYKAYAKFVFTVASVVSDVLKMLIDIGAQALLKTKKGGLFADVGLAILELKIIKNVAKLGWILLSARGTVSILNLIPTVSNSIGWQVREQLPEKNYDLQGV
ncbi:MAG: hypothetical protein HOV77_02700 [Hamadaea sp.]|uniref:WXG100-like domain-containing protein n=1 Tax=Hamadaea sp. TaxID=2024425 RepID=UPI001797328F|nr:hypothetical protein [Hamadaea sp.]NUT18068.1 hypothetical protein [Hamadaea sp.]